MRKALSWGLISSRGTPARAQRTAYSPRAQEPRYRRRQAGAGCGPGDLHRDRRLVKRRTGVAISGRRHHAKHANGLRFGRTGHQRLRLPTSGLVRGSMAGATSLAPWTDRIVTGRGVTRHPLASAKQIQRSFAGPSALIHNHIHSQAAPARVGQSKRGQGLPLVIAGSRASRGASPASGQNGCGLASRVLDLTWFQRHPEIRFRDSTTGFNSPGNALLGQPVLPPA